MAANSRSGNHLIGPFVVNDGLYERTSLNEYIVLMPLPPLLI